MFILSYYCAEGRQSSMAEAMMLSVGIDNFEKIRKSDFYYIDKTKFFELRKIDNMQYHKQSCHRYYRQNNKAPRIVQKAICHKQ